jgi:hypothetical protein
MKTSATVVELGLYVSECCDEELVFDIGDTFCRCPKCEGLCEWELVEPLVPLDEPEAVEEWAA